MTLPLKLLPDGSKFRLPGKPGTYTRINGCETLPVSQGGVIEHRTACLCRNSSGRTVVLDEMRMVEVV